VSVRSAEHAGKAAAVKLDRLNTSPPSRTRTQRLFGTSANHTAPSASMQIPSGGASPRSAQIRRFDRLPHLAPALLGGRLRLFDRMDTEDAVELEVTRVIDSPRVTQIRYRVLK
jgi:hypothetical protein